jgi:hypothetical protein
MASPVDLSVTRLFELRLHSEQNHPLESGYFTGEIFMQDGKLHLKSIQNSRKSLSTPF